LFTWEYCPGALIAPAATRVDITASTRFAYIATPDVAGIVWARIRPWSAL